MDMEQGYLGRFPKVNLIASVIIGIALWCYGFKTYFAILSLEESGGETSMPRFFWWLYDAMGAIGVLGFFILGGIFFFYRAFQAYKDMAKAKDL